MSWTLRTHCAGSLLAPPCCPDNTWFPVRLLRYATSSDAVTPACGFVLPPVGMVNWPWLSTREELKVAWRPPALLAEVRYSDQIMNQAHLGCAASWDGDGTVPTSAREMGLPCDTLTRA